MKAGRDVAAHEAEPLGRVVADFVVGDVDAGIAGTITGHGARAEHLLVVVALRRR